MVAELLIAPGAVSSMASHTGAAPSGGNARPRSLSPQRRAQSLRPTQPQPALGVDIARVTQLTTDFFVRLGSVVQQLAASQTEIQRQLNLLISGQSAASVGQQSPVPPQQAAGTPSPGPANPVASPGQLPSVPPLPGTQASASAGPSTQVFQMFTGSDASGASGNGIFGGIPTPVATVPPPR